jgi:hypothetical protein
MTNFKKKIAEFLGSKQGRSSSGMQCNVNAWQPMIDLLP